MDIWKKLVSNYFGWNEKEKEPPTGGIRRVGYIIINYPGKLFVINIVFLLCCLPIVTAPAAFIALNRYVFRIFQKGYDFSLADYWDEFKSSLGRRIPLGILAGFLCFYGYYLMSLAGNFAEETMHAVVIGIGIAFAVMGLLMGAYTFFLSAVLELPNKAIIKNAFLLIFLDWKATLGVLVIIVAELGLLVAFSPYSLYLVLIGGASIGQLGICALLYPVVRKRIIEPYERQSV